MAVKLYGLGAGTGDAELITVKALRILHEVDCIYCADSGKASVLESLIAHWGFQEKTKRLSFLMKRDKRLISAQHDAIYQEIKARLLEGKNVAYLTLGDPSFYSTFTSLQRRALKDEFEVETVAGVIAPCAAAARANRPLVEGTQKLTIVPALDTELLDELPQHALSFMKVKFRYDELKEALRKRGILDQAYMGVRLGLEGEEFYPHIDEAPRPNSYFATINVSAYHGADSDNLEN